MNKVFISGNACAKPELKYTSSGTAVCEFSLAVNEGPKDKQKSYFFSVQVWDKFAEYFCACANKGDALDIQGRLIQEAWEKNGEKQSRTRIVAEEIRFVTFKRAGEAKQPERKASRPTPSSKDEPDDDIPF